MIRSALGFLFLLGITLFPSLHATNAPGQIAADYQLTRDDAIIESTSETTSQPAVVGSVLYVNSKALGHKGLVTQRHPA